MIDDQIFLIEWIQSRIKAKKFNISLWETQHSNTVNEFLEKPSIKSLFAAVDQEVNKLIIVIGVPPTPSPNIVDVTYFLRAEGEMVTAKTIDQSLVYGTIPFRQTASSVLKIMETQFYPNIFHSREWNQSSKQELLGLYHRFLASLTESANEESGKTMLYIPLRNDEDIDLETSIRDKSVIQQLEAVAIHWIRQIKEVLNSHEHNIALNYQGPMEELRFWEVRAEDLAGISDQLNSPEIVRILSILKKVKSKYASPVEALTGTLKRGATEAQNSVKFLKLLQEPCKLMSTLKPADIPPIMPQFLNCIRLIYFHSANYKSHERISDLIRRVSTEIIRHCSSQISLKEIFYGDLNKGMVTLVDCIKCGNLWKKLYDEIAVRVNKKKESMDGEAPGEKWKLGDASIFAEMDAFVQRCDDLTDICNGRVQFIELLSSIWGATDDTFTPIISGTNGPEIENSLQAIQEAFIAQLDRLSRLDYSILNVRESRWHGHYNSYKLAIKDLDIMLTSTINGALEKIQVIDTAAYLLCTFHKIAHRPAIKHCVYKRSMKLRALFLQQCQKTRHEFDDFHRNPPLRLNEPSFAGSALWAKALCTLVENGWLSVCNATSQNSEYDDNLESTYLELITALSAYQQQKYSDWLQSLSELDTSLLQERLDQPILRITPDMKNDKFNHLMSNFDCSIMSILSESQFWDKLHNDDFVTPNEILGILHQRDSLRICRGRTMVLVRAHNDFIQDLEGTSNLYLDYVRALRKKLRPGFKKILWSTRPVIIDKFVQTMMNLVQQSHAKLKLFHAGMSRIKAECEKISSTRLVHIDQHAVYEGVSFEKEQKNVRTKAKETISKSHNAIRKEMDEMYKQFHGGSADVENEWRSHVIRVDAMVLDSLTRCISSSLRELSQTMEVHQPYGGETYPLFRTHAVIQNGKIGCSPSLITITNSVNTVSKETVAVARAVENLFKCTPSPSSAKHETYYDKIAGDEVILNQIVQIMNRMSLCARCIHDRLAEWDKYKALWTMDKSSFLKRYSKSGGSQETEKFKLQQKAIEAEKGSCSINFIFVHFTSLKSELSNHAMEFQKGLLDLMKQTSSKIS